VVALRVVGAGVGRTGTHSLKLALEQLLGAPCYHMTETFGKPDHVAQWRRAVDGAQPDWDLIFDGYAAAVDWPTAAFYAELAARAPDAVVLLSVRPDAEAWWRSASATIFAAVDGVSGAPPDLERMILDLFDKRFTPDWRHHDAAVAAYLRHNAEVRSVVPADRPFHKAVGDGWGPLCAALGLPVPPDAFPHVNTTAEFRAMTGLA